MALTPKSATNPITKTQARDGNRQPIYFSAGAFVTQDASASPKTSPLTVSSSEVVLTVPDNAVQLVISNNANALLIYETSGNSATAAYTLPASTTNFVIDCARMTNIYLIRSSADVTVQFMFVTVA